MNYQQTLEFLYNQLPMFHRIGKAAYKANLNNAHALDQMCGFPHKSYKTIHVAGTNGKGSVSHMLAAVLQQAGYKTGLFTSPHLIDFRERIRVNGEMIPEKNVIEFVTQFKDEFGKIQPSFFEMTSALAFYYFQKEKVDIAVIETGLGGRLDSTNIITPELSVITNIGFDHTELLGDTLPKIATEKAGIIKQGVPVVIGETHRETQVVFNEFAARNSSLIGFADKVYSASAIPSQEMMVQQITAKNLLNGNETCYELDLKGLYQQRNLCTVLAAIDVLNKKEFRISFEDVYAGLKTVSEKTGLLGRWQILSQNPLTICDTGHNEDGVRWVVDQINKLKFNKLHFVFGVVSDKDVTKILSLLPSCAEYYFTKANIPRAMDENELHKKASEAGLNGKSYPSVKKALEAVKINSAANDLIFIGGSTFIVADALLEQKNN